MSGKRAKPSPWRFLRATPVAMVAVVVWVMVGLFLLLPGSGSDQADDWGLDPIPSTSADEKPSDPDSSTPFPEESTPGTPSSTDESDGPTSTPEPARKLELSRASASGRTAQPSPQPSSDTTASADPTDPAPTQAEPGPPVDNPGKKKGHDKPHGPHGQP